LRASLEDAVEEGNDVLMVLVGSTMVVQAKARPHPVIPYRNIGTI